MTLIMSTTTNKTGRKKTPYQGGAWAVGGLLSRHQLPRVATPAEVCARRDQVAAQLAHAQQRAAAGLPVYARIADVLRADLAELVRMFGRLTSSHTRRMAMLGLSA